MKNDVLIEFIELGSEIADSLIDQSEGGIHAFIDTVDENDVTISYEDAEELLQTIHSAVVEEVIRWSKEKRIKNLT